MSKGPPARIGDRLKPILLLLAGAVLLSGCALYRPDLSVETLQKRYGALVWTDASQFLKLPDGALVHYRDEGPRDVPVIVLVHGVNDSLHSFEPLVEALKDRFRLISMDLPGHGLTGPLADYPYTTDALDRFLSDFTGALGLKHFAMAGSSLGGGLSWRYAVGHPGAVTKLILLDPTGLPPRVESPPGFVARASRNPLVNAMLAKLSMYGVAKAGLKKAYADDALVSDALVTRTAALLRRTGNRKAALTRLRTPWTYPLVGRIGDLKLPILLLWGRDDVLLPPDDYIPRFKQAWPQAQVLIFDHTGHLPQQEATQAAAMAIRDFMTGKTIPGLALPSEVPVN